jgi:hypothetical protein
VLRTRRSPERRECPKGDIMRKLLIGAALCSLFAVPGFAGEPTKLTSAEMDKVTAGRTAACVVAACFQINATDQDATAVAIGGVFGDTTAVASNVNVTDQEIGSQRD